MRYARRLGRIAIATGLCGVLAAGNVYASLGTAIEYYNPALRHYFITAYPEEVAALDAGTNVKGWTRTGGQFTVFTDPAPGLSAVRTFKPAANNGTDHGWGNYAFAMGGVVKGGDFYGTVPTQALNGPDDLGKDGRWIPTTSLEQYGATLCRWFGIAEADLTYVFPNIGAFANTNMGFMA